MEFLALHSELVRTLTSTVRRRELGASLSALVVPKPVTVASEPGCGKDVSAGGRQEKKLQKEGTTKYRTIHQTKAGRQSGSFFIISDRVVWLQLISPDYHNNAL